MKNLKSKKNSRKKILIVTHNLNFEGAPLFLFNLAKGLKAVGYDIEILSPVEGPLKSSFLKKGMKTTIANFLSREFRFLNTKEYYDLFIVNTIAGYKFIEKLDLKKEKLIWCLHESEKDFYFEKNSELSEILFSRVNKVVFPSRATKEMYEDMDVNNNFIIINTMGDWRLIYDFINKNSKKAIRKKTNFKNSDIIINLIGTICPRKGQLEFTEVAIAILKEINNPNLKFLMVGGGRGFEYEKAIHKLVCANKLENQILIVDETDEIFDYYLISDIFVCNSYIEAFPLCILEAMAFSLPIISTNVYGISEQIESGKEGLLIMAGDNKELKNKIMYLLKNRGEAIKLGENARKKIENKFQFNEMINKYDKLIQETIQ